MEAKKEKLNKAYEHIRSLGFVHTKKDFAAAIDFDKSNMSSAFKGNEKYLTDGLFKKICDKYPNIFNIKYFLNDEGEMIENKNGNEVNGNGNTSVAGNGNQITTSHIAEMFELQKGYQEMIKTGQAQLSESQSQINKLIAIIEQFNK